MGGASFSRMALYAFSFIGIFALIFATIPPAFFITSFASSAGASKETAELFSMANVTMYANSGNDTMVYPYSSYFDMSPSQWGAGLAENQYLEVRWDLAPLFSRSIAFRHIEEVWWGRPILDDCVFTTVEGVDTGSIFLFKAGITGQYREDLNGSAWTARCGHITVSTVFQFNQSDYPTIGEAWDAGDMSYTLTYQPDWNASQVSAMTVLGQLLTFQAPSLGLTGVSGLILNAMLAFPIYIMTAILIIKLVQSVIPLIGGIDD